MSKDPTVLWAFFDEQVAQLTGLSTRQIRYWRKTEFYVPSGGRESCFYTFRDVVALKTLAVIRGRRVPLQELRKVSAWLKEFSDHPWSKLRLYLGGRNVYFQHPETGLFLARKPENQSALPISLEAIEHDARAAVSRVRARKSDDVGRIDHNRRILSNKPTVAGTRVATSAIWELSEAGRSIEQILEEYPVLGVPDVKAALAHEKRQRANRGKRRSVA